MTDSIPSNVSHENTPVDRRRDVNADRRNVERRTGRGGHDKPFVAKGHDKQLQDAQNAGTRVIVALQTDLDIEGVITRRDKFTVTVRPSEGTFAGRELMVYKHAIAFIAL